MLDIILLIILVLAIFGFFAIRAGIRQRLSNELATCYNEATQLIQSCTSGKLPAELVLALDEPIKELALDLKELEKAFGRETAIFKFKQILREDKPLLEAKSQEVKNICARWNDYAAFKQQITDGLSDLISRDNNLAEISQALVRYDKELEDIVNIRATSIISQLADYQNQYRELRKVSFAEYDEEEHQVPIISTEFLNQVKFLTNELKYFRNHLRVYIAGLYRKSIYYLALEDSSDKSPRRHADTVQVSYKTFQSYEKGAPYKWNIIIGGKYASSEQNITIKALKGDIETKITHKLTKEQFDLIYQSITFNRKFDEVDEEEIPYQLNVMDLEFLICEKKANDFEVTFYSDLFIGNSIYDFLSYHESIEIMPTLMDETQAAPTAEKVPAERADNEESKADIVEEIEQALTSEPT